MAGTRARHPVRAEGGDEAGSASVEAAAVAAAGALTILDAVATYVWLTVGIAIEGNPILLALMETIGETAALVVRVVVGGGLLLLLWALTPRSRLAAPGLFAVAAVLAAVGIWHLQGFAYLRTA